MLDRTGVGPCGNKRHWQVHGSDSQCLERQKFAAKTFRKRCCFDPPTLKVSFSKFSRPTGVPSCDWEVVRIGMYRTWDHMTDNSMWDLGNRQRNPRAGPDRAMDTDLLQCPLWVSFEDDSGRPSRQVRSSLFRAAETARDGCACFRLRQLLLLQRPVWGMPSA